MPFGYFKGQPNEHVVKFVGGKAAKQGDGISFFYLPSRTSVVVVPTNSAEASFVFRDLTSNFQEVVIQGQFTYRVTDPNKTAALLNYVIDPRRRTYLTKDPESLPNRIATVMQAKVHDQILSRSLEASIRDSETIANALFDAVKSDPTLAGMGVTVLTVHIQSIRPTPEVAKALEAEYRETLLRKADEAIYARRASAVEEERKIKEKELATNVVLAQQRAELIDLEGQNALQEAKNKAEAEQIQSQSKVEALKQELAAYQTMAPNHLAALGFNRMAEKGVERLTITSEVLSSLLDAKAE